MSNLTPRGYLVAGIALGLALAGIYWIAGNLWWTGEGYCIGSLVKCFH